MRIIVFGSNGMLGSYVKSYMSQTYEVISITRNDLDLSEVTKINLKELLINKKINKDDVIVNCAGVIKQRCYNINDMIMVNSVFPNLLAELENKVIHITSDCVYNGTIGGYNENVKFDCNDDYGQTKCLGENPNITMIRTSIIGEEKNNNRSLLEWVRSNKGGNIDGYSNHLWNGMTCLELAKFIYAIISKQSYWKGPKHIFSPTVSKFELVSIINEVYELNITINEKQTEEHCYRNLDTIYEKCEMNDMRQQINELKEYGELL